MTFIGLCSKAKRFSLIADIWASENLGYASYVKLCEKNYVRPVSEVLFSQIYQALETEFQEATEIGE